MRKLSQILLLVSALSFFAACGGGGGGSIGPGGGGTPATKFSVTGPTASGAGISFNFTVTALDSANGVATNYSGTVHFTSSDPVAVLPPNSMLTNGTGSFSATLTSSGFQSITASDTASASLTGSA